MHSRFILSFTLSVLLPSFFITCVQSKRDYRGDVNRYESFMVAQSDTILTELFKDDCTLLNNHFLISDTSSIYQINCLLLDTLRSAFSRDFQYLPARVNYSYAEIPGYVVSRVSRSALDKQDTLTLTCWFFSGVDWESESFDSSSTTPVALELWHNSKQVYKLHQHGF